MGSERGETPQELEYRSQNPESLIDQSIEDATSKEYRTHSVLGTNYRNDKVKTMKGQILWKINERISLFRTIIFVRFFILAPEF